MRPTLLVFGVALAAAGLSAQQSPTAPVVFRAAVDYVEVDATVTDARGNAVSDLAASDFEVLEDGKPQTITSFARIDLTFQRAVPSSLVADSPICRTSRPTPRSRAASI